MNPDPRSVRFRRDELDAIAVRAEQLGLTENGYVRMVVRRDAGLPLPADVERRLLRDDLATGRQV